MRRYLVVMLALVLLAAAPGCFPADVGDAGNLEVRLPLGSLGVVVDDNDIDAYSRYVQMKQELSEMTFDLGREGQNFYLGLYLTCQGGEPASLGGSGQWLSFDSNTDELTLSLLVGDCLQGVFSTAIYWRAPDSGTIELFTGTSDPYDLPGDSQTIILDAYLHPAGSAGCVDTPGAGTFYYTVIDTVENVRYPWLERKVADGEQVEFTISDLAVGRPYKLLRGAMNVTGAIEWEDLTPTFSLESAGQHVDDACTLLPAG